MMSGTLNAIEPNGIKLALGAHAASRAGLMEGSVFLEELSPQAPHARPRALPGTTDLLNLTPLALEPGRRILR